MSAKAAKWLEPRLNGGKPGRRVRTGRTRIVLLAGIGLMLAVLSPLVIAASPTSADDSTELTTTTISVNPTVVAPGQPIVFSAVVVPEAPAVVFATPSAAEIVTLHPVVFTMASITLCSATMTEVSNTELTGSCTLNPSLLPLPIGTLTIEGTFGGGSAVDGAQSGSYLVGASSGQTTLTVVTPTVTMPSVSPTTTVYGDSVTYSVTIGTEIAPGIPSGTVLFTYGLIPLCTATLVTPTPTPSNKAGSFGSCTAANAPVGTDTITATFGGDAVFAVSSGTVQLVVNPPPSAPTPPAPTPPVPPTPTPTPPPVVTSPSPTVSHGYWLVGSDGGIFTFGSAQFYGSTGNLHLQRPVVGITPTAGDLGYWLVASDGGIFSFGNAGFYGSIPGLGISPAGSGGPRSLNAGIVGMVPSYDGQGYFMVGADGGVFTFGDARFEGSCVDLGGCAGGAAVAVVPDSTGDGYWVITVGGDVTPFGDAAAYGSPGPIPGTVVSAVRTPDGGGYYVLFANGEVFAYGDATYRGGAYGEVGGTNPAAAIFTTANGDGYWIVSANGSVITEGDAPYEGGANNLHLNGAIIAGTGW